MNKNLLRLLKNAMSIIKKFPDGELTLHGGSYASTDKIVLEVGKDEFLILLKEKPELCVTSNFDTDYYDPNRKQVWENIITFDDVLLRCYTPKEWGEQ